MAATQRLNLTFFIPNTESSEQAILKIRKSLKRRNLEIISECSSFDEGLKSYIYTVEIGLALYSKSLPTIRSAMVSFFEYRPTLMGAGK